MAELKELSEFQLKKIEELTQEAEMLTAKAEEITKYRKTKEYRECDPRMKKFIQKKEYLYKKTAEFCKKQVLFINRNKKF